MSNLASSKSASTGAGSAAPFHERLYPAPWMWLVVLLLTGLASVVPLPYGVPPALITGVVVLGALTGLLVAWTPTITVQDGELVAGRAHVPLRLLGAVTPLDAAGMRHAHGPGLDVRAYLCIRGWIGTGVRADLADPQDPTPYWLISTRRPEQLAAALEAGRAGHA